MRICPTRIRRREEEAQGGGGGGGGGGAVFISVVNTNEDPPNAHQAQLGFPLHLVHVKFLASELQVGKTSRQVDIWGYDHYESRQFNRFRESRVQRTRS